MPEMPSDTQDIALRAALFGDMRTIARDQTLPLFRTGTDVENKDANSGGFDPVTEADKACERALRAIIEKQFPADGIIGEEYGATRPDADYQWIIDPIDGTRAFIAGIPLWGTLIGLLHHGQPVAGMGYQPFIDEAFTASAGSAQYWLSTIGERSMKTRSCNDIAGATLMTTSPALFEGAQREAYDTVEQACRTVRYGTDWYAYAMVAVGTCDLVVETGLAPYDILPLVPIIEAAGGTVTNWQGGAMATEGFTGQVIAAGDPKVHEQALALLRNAAATVS